MSSADGKTRRYRHTIGLGLVAGGLLGAALIPVAAMPEAHAIPGGVISCVVGEGCTITPAPGIPVEGHPGQPPLPYGPPLVVSCVINEGCTTYPAGGFPGHGHVFDPQPVDPHEGVPSGLPGDPGITAGSPDPEDSFGLQPFTLADAGWGNDEIGAPADVAGGTDLVGGYFDSIPFLGDLPTL